MDSKLSFFDTINRYYTALSFEKIPPNLLTELSNIITDYYYEQYLRFGKQYPKSIKRYSTFQLKDLEHPETFELIINFFKAKVGVKYPEYATILLQMDLDKLKYFEQQRQLYHNR